MANSILFSSQKHYTKCWMKSEHVISTAFVAYDKSSDEQKKQGQQEHRAARESERK